MSESLSGFALLFIWIAESFELVYKNVQNAFTNLASLHVKSFPCLWLDVSGRYSEQAGVFDVQLEDRFSPGTLFRWRRRPGSGNDFFPYRAQFQVIWTVR